MSKLKGRPLPYIKLTFKVNLRKNLFKIASKVTSIMKILAIITFAGEHIFNYWFNTRKYYHKTFEYSQNTCKYCAAEYTLRKSEIIFFSYFESI